MNRIPKVPAILIVTPRFSGTFPDADLRALKRFANPVVFQYPSRLLAAKPVGCLETMWSVLRFTRQLILTGAPVVVFCCGSFPGSLMALISKSLFRKVVVIPGGEDSLLPHKPLRQHALREELVRLVPSLSAPVVRIELGCGTTGVGGTIGVDVRRTAQTQVVCDVCHTPFASGSADEVYSYCVLEHLENPYELLDEVVRLLKPTGCAYFRVPNLGTYSAHLDRTHCFLADLSIWKGIMKGYFELVKVKPLGTKYRDNRLLVLLNAILVRVFRFYELAQGWEFVCEKPRSSPCKGYVGWWMERADH